MHLFALTNPTQFAGLLSYGGAIAACVIALSRRSDRTWWIVIAATFVGLALDVGLGLRFELTQLLGNLMGYDQWYGVRRPVQAGIIVVAALGLAVMVWRLWRGGARRETRIAGVLAAIGLGLCLLEAISLHQVNEWTSRKIGPIMLIAWGWVSIGLGVVGCVARRMTR